MEGFVDLIDHGEGVHLSQFAPLTTLLVWTWNSQYRLVVMDHSHVCVQGGACFPGPTSARLDGASKRDGLVMSGWICLGLAMELRAGGMRILTSPVLAITTEAPRDPIVH